MRKQQAHATTLRLEQAEREAMARLRDLSGCPSDRAALKLALRIVARADPTHRAPKGLAIHPLDESQGRNGSIR